MKRYNILNNSLGWFCFVVAAVTYLLTLEPTASFWDCPEFILQGYKLEVGHPPGNPIFMLTARFFANFAMGDVTKVAWMINAMSGLLSAATILLLFWTITHLVKRLTVKADATEISPMKMVVIFGSGLCGALMYTWSDTFWFSAVEGEVYAFSSFCTALVFWLILKWENRADRPRSDRYLILIAYVIGISIAVHLLNLLCIPAIVLVIYYRKWSNATAKGSCVALLVSFIIVALILYGLVPGFIEVSQYFEVFCVNTLHMSFNMGVLIYAIAVVAAFVWTIFNIYTHRSHRLIKISFFISVLLSGIFFIGDSWWLPMLLIIALCIYLIKVKTLPIRVINIVATSILVIFIGYSSYALLLIRSSAHTPMNQNAPDNVFALSSYLNREQYGDRPLFYGETFSSMPVYQLSMTLDNNGKAVYKQSPIYLNQPETYTKKIKKTADDADEYLLVDDNSRRKAKLTPELNMPFPRIYSSGHVPSYTSWIGQDVLGKPVLSTIYVDMNGDPIPGEERELMKPTVGENIKFFMIYQLNHMYWRYFMWNFAGRQNDIQGDGEPTHGNWISGIPFIDNPRLGDQSLLPDELGKGNAGHNVFYMLPLLLGLIGLIWQASCGKRGIEQFWVIFFLFFMTGIAIVLYLNQTPDQPRERDYAFAGSFYAFAIWVGMGVAGIWRMLCKCMIPRTEDTTPVSTDVNLSESDPESKFYGKAMTAACIAAVIGLIVPLQVVSQTWDDHDRSGRYTARDFGMNYLNSLDENAIIFTYGDNDTFPLWYAQEVEGVRTDVKVVNLSYLQTDWYINQLRRQSYDAPGIGLMAPEEAYAYNNLQVAVLGHDTTPTTASDALKRLYSGQDFNTDYNVPVIRSRRLVIPVDTAAAVRSGRITPEMGLMAEDIQIAFPDDKTSMYLNEIMSLDMLANSAANGWNRPVYYAITVPDSYYSHLSPYMHQTGLAAEVLPLPHDPSKSLNTDKSYRNLTQKFRWGGLDKVTAPGQVYLDETVRRMVITNRGFMANLATELAIEGLQAKALLESPDSLVVDKDELSKYIADRKAKADTVMMMHKEKIPEAAMPYTVGEILGLLDLYEAMYGLTDDEQYLDLAYELVSRSILRYADHVRYQQSLSPRLKGLLTREDRLSQQIFNALVQEYYPRYGGDTDTLRDVLLKEKGITLPDHL